MTSPVKRVRHQLCPTSRSAQPNDNGEQPRTMARRSFFRRHGAGSGDSFFALPQTAKQSAVDRRLCLHPLPIRCEPYHAEGRVVHRGKFGPLMSALGQKRTSQGISGMSALPPIADIGTQSRDVRFVPKATLRGTLGANQSAYVPNRSDEVVIA